MRRLMITVAATVTGAVAVVTYQPALERHAASLRDAGSDGAGSDGAGSDGAGSDGAGSDGAGSDGAAQPLAGDSAKVSWPQTPGQSVRGASGSSGSGSALAWHDGPQVQTPAGVVQVRVGFDGRAIGDVQLVRGPSATRHSVWLSRQAVTILRAEVLNAQSAGVDMISGATYTSEGYLHSLQAALDAAKGS